MRRVLYRSLYRLPGWALLAWLVPVPVLAQQPSPPHETIQPSPDAKPVIDPDGTYHLGNGVTPPILVYSVDAEFSNVARRKKIQGDVVVGLKVGTDGLPKDVHVVRSAAESVTKPKDRKAAATLDEKALEPVRQYRFQPGMYEGKAVPVAITIDVNFHIY